MTTMDTMMAWETVADRLEALGLKLKLHFEQAESAKEIAGAFERLGGAIEATFQAIGDAAEDPAVREDATALATALGDALADTLSQAGHEVASATKGLRCHQHHVGAATQKK